MVKLCQNTGGWKNATVHLTQLEGLESHRAHIS